MFYTIKGNTGHLKTAAAVLNRLAQKASWSVRSISEREEPEELSCVWPLSIPSVENVAVV